MDSPELVTVTQADIAAAMDVFEGSRPSMLEIDRVSKLFAAYRGRYETKAAALHETIHEQKFALEDMMARVGRLHADKVALVEALEHMIGLLRATDELQANGFADDAVNIARAAITKEFPDDQ